MIKPYFLVRTLVVSLLLTPIAASADSASSACDTCSQLQIISAYSQDTSTNTAATNSWLQQLIGVVTNALFGTLYDLGNTMTAFTAIPALQNNGYNDQLSLLHTVETTYQGNSDKNATLENNYKTIFNNYLLPNGGTFDVNNASIATLYLNPSSAGYYTDDQRLAAQRYIVLASGAAMSTMRKPSQDWLKIDDKSANKDEKKIRTEVSSYYTYSAIQSAIADNFAYIYGLNTGQTIDGTLKDYSSTFMSESGIINYILSQKAVNPDWYDQINNMGVIGLMREQTILLGGSFLMLTRIEESLKRILVTNSAQTTLSLIGSKALSDTLSELPVSTKK
ncbi:MAG: hypothetical protein LRY67_00030 [Gammaproteobacteria bacterium]|nr:hypothetical protein [Gammaproteobacteria bacterium]MCD8541930.1 hypothetical protein [Gammaproteobacteria bacterium]